MVICKVSTWRGQRQIRVYVDNDKESDLVIVIYVDDLLIGSRDIHKLNERKKALRQKFKMNDLELISNILGVHIERDGLTGSMKLSQKRYANDLLMKFEMSDSKPIATSMEPRAKISRKMTQSQNI